MLTSGYFYDMTKIKKQSIKELRQSARDKMLYAIECMEELLTRREKDESSLPVTNYYDRANYHSIISKVTKQRGKIK